MQDDKTQDKDDHDDAGYFCPTGYPGINIRAHWSKLGGNQGKDFAKAGKGFANLANVYTAGSMGMWIFLSN